MLKIVTILVISSIWLIIQKLWFRGCDYEFTEFLKTYYGEFFGYKILLVFLIIIFIVYAYL